MSQGWQSGDSLGPLNWRLLARIKTPGKGASDAFPHLWQRICNTIRRNLRKHKAIAGIVQW
ncbi:MAG: hypothetical protein EBU79_06795 [Betaproteobacteria bacterium]|nr:hypothetical protein [Betaproteobacteria bacterium]